MPPRPSEVTEEPHSRAHAVGEPVLLGAGAVLLICAPLLPGLSRVVVLPALLLAPGFAFLRLLGQARYRRSISIAVPVSIVLIVCSALVLDVSGFRLDATSLGALLGALSALCLAGSYGRELGISTVRTHRRPRGDQGTARRNADVEGRR